LQSVSDPNGAEVALAMRSKITMRTVLSIRGSKQIHMAELIQSTSL